MSPRSSAPHRRACRRLKSQSDLYLSTLKRYVEALGGELEVAAVFDGERIEIGVPAGSS